uniref:VP1 capsid n=2 Tax=Rat adeno-associated virus 1 TaxID=341227 RepID=Q2VJ48_9VIRU|nr:VP1 capsid [Rat adeno-associated virus 1]
MSFFDWIGRKYANGAAEFWDLEPGPPKPKKARVDDSAGFNFPGHKYLGPGNGLDRGEPVDADDAAAQKHDQEYQALLESGENPYLTFNHADRQLQKDLAEDQSFEGNLARGLFEAKKLAAQVVGVEEPELAPPVKRPHSPEKTPENQKGQPRPDPRTPAKKRLEFSDQPGSSADLPASSQQSQPPAGVPGVVPGTMSAGGGAPVDDAQQGADGVGNASGDWHCDSKWLGNRVLTRSTRTWVLPSYNNHLYKQISDASGVHSLPGSRYFGYSTPWGYFDFNRFHCHFSPRDWQRLVNNHWGFRPKRLRVKLFNIQVKEVTTTDSTTTVSNNLTSTVQVFTDDEYQLPYVCGNATEGCLPPFPPDVFTLPQYGYATLNDSNNGNPTNRSSFFCLEYFPSKMLRTGNNFEFTFEFEDVPFHTGFAPCQNLFKLSNPLVDQYLYRFQGTDNSSSSTPGVVKFEKCVAHNYAQQYKNWLTGAFQRNQDYNYVSGTSNYKGVVGSNQNNLQRIENVQFAIAPDVPSMCNHLEGTNMIALDNSLIFRDVSTAPGDTTQYNINQVIVTSEAETQSVNAYSGDTCGRIVNNSQNSGTNAGTTGINYKGTMPSSVWMDRDVYLQGPIWAKIPHTGAHFHPSPMMGGFGLRNPPPMMLIKNTPVPGNVTTFTEVKVNQFITQYSTGQITVDVEWELQKENSKRWNPEIQYTNNYSNNTFVDFAPNANGDYQMTRPIGTRYPTRPP